MIKIKLFSMKVVQKISGSSPEKTSLENKTNGSIAEPEPQSQKEKAKAVGKWTALASVFSSLLGYFKN